MNPIAVFYHYRLSGGRPAISEPHAARIFAAQMEALGVSGLAEAARHQLPNLQLNLVEPGVVQSVGLPGRLKTFAGRGAN